MNYKVVEDRDSSCTVFGSNESPNFLLTPHQQHRLQAAVLQQEIPLFDALLPIVHDLRMGVGRLPIVHPLPHATMQIHQGPPPNPTPLSGPPADPHYGSQYTYGSLPTPQVVRGPVSVPVSLPVSLPVPVPVPVPMPPDFSKPPPGYPFLPSSPDVVPMLPDLSKPPPNFKPVSE
ncbi:hypothetical protein KR009_003631 [Drosophila setifemur]|nr:hypothetical protein KR009_003631 [Drosophila setifemur]